MRTGFLFITTFLFLNILIGNVLAQADTGATTINTTITGVYFLNISLKHSEIFVPEDYYFYDNLTLYQVSYEDIYVYLNKTDGNDFVKFVNETGGYVDQLTLQLPRFVYENVTIQVYVPSGMGFDGGIYYIPIHANSQNDSRTNTTTLKVHVNATNPVDDIEITNINPSSLYSGESLYVDISIHKIYPTETTDIQICYCIDSSPSYLCSPSLNNYGCSWKAITDWLNYTKIVTVNENAGEYYFIVAVKYPGDSNIKRANSPKFYVLSTPVTPSDGGRITGIVMPEVELAIKAPDYFEASPGDRISFEVEIENQGNAKAYNTTLDVYGVPESWISVTSEMQDIEVGESKNYSVSVSIPSVAYEQVYYLFLVAKSGTVEATKAVTLTIAINLENMAEFLLGEAQSKRNEARKIIDMAKDLGMDTTEPENIMTSTNGILVEAQGLFESGSYRESIEKSKQAIDGYKSVMDSVKNQIIREAYFLLLDEIMKELREIEPLTDEKDVIESITSKVSQSVILEKEGRIIEAYLTLLETKQLLDQLKGKIYFKGLTQNILLASFIIIILIAISMLLFYRKMISNLMKTTGTEKKQ